MKRNLFIILCFLFIFIFTVNGKVYAVEDYTYETSDGVKFCLDDIVIYDTDLIDKNFDSQDEFIDYIYEVGFNRTSVCDDTYTILGHKVTKAELDLCKVSGYLQYMSIGFQCANDAKEKTQKLYGYTTDETKANSFQHAYWVMLMYFHTSPQFTKDEAYAHEEYDGNDAMSKYMDLYNDDRAYEKASTITYTNDDNLASYAKELVDSGKLIYIIRNYSYIKEKIYYTSTGKIETKYTTGDFYCYTNTNIPYGVPEPKVTRVKYEIMQGSLMEA